MIDRKPTPLVPPIEHADRFRRSQDLSLVCPLVWRDALLFLGGLIMFQATLLGQNMVQQFELNPGWNSIFLQVQPQQNDISSVFEGIPIASVWTRIERLSSADFIENQNEVEWNAAEWSVYYPEGSPESFLSTLHAVHVNRPYLVKIAASRPVSLVVVGRPSLRYPAWVPDEYNLRGFPIDAANPPTFLEHFRYAEAHYRSDLGRLEEIYRLGADGLWELVNASDRMENGVAYWTFSRGASQFVAPLEIELQQGDGLDFDAILEELRLTIVNSSPATRQVAIRNLLGGNQSSLAYYRFEVQTGAASWLHLPAVHEFDVSFSADHRMRIGVRRASFSSEVYGTVLRISDNQGTSHLVPVRAFRSNEGSSGNLSVASQESVSPFMGLWIGTVRVTSVSESNRPDPFTPTPTHTEFPLRLLMHVDPDDKARLLKEVIQMWEDGTIILAPSFPTNPYRHKYHPDHDNLDARFEAFRPEAYEVVRALELEFTEEDPTRYTSPDYGHSTIGGTYRETLFGLHHQPIFAQGDFRLHRIIDDPELNPEPRSN